MIDFKKAIACRKMARVTFNGISDIFPVSGYDEQGCKIRAISHFLWKHPEIEQEMQDGDTFRIVAARFIAAGLTCELT